MKIGPADNSSGPLRPDEGGRRGADTGPIPIERQNQSDSIEISQDGRMLAEQKLAKIEKNDNSQKAVLPPPAELPDLLSARVEDALEAEDRSDKIEQAKKRVESGYYDTPQARNEIARRITGDFIG